MTLHHMLNRFLPIITFTGSLLAVGLWVGLPAATAASAPEGASQNWAGYVVTPSTGSSGFSRVSGSWVQPSADPSAGDGYSAFWVGLGGSGQSQSLEQIGTQADVGNGQTSYYAWYELVPSAPVRINVPIQPGDHISASVSVQGSNVTVSLTDQTTGRSYTNTLQMSNPDTSSAEWIAEAPSASDGQGDLQPLSLADFATVDFTSASATAGEHTGSISDSDWTNQPVALSSSSTAGAQPSSLSTDGSSFSVTWQGAGDATGTSYPSAGVPGQSGYGYGYGYGGYGYGGYGSGGYGYGGYGYGYGGGYGYGLPGYAYSY
jgi:Peptidase A4 family